MSDSSQTTTAAEPTQGTVAEVFLAFLKLGLTSFGGPIAHLGYFRDELVERRRWIDERGYADLVALCQFLPGPASSQAGFALGLLRAGPPGALAAFIAFTTPSAILMLLFAYWATTLGDAFGGGLIRGLKIVAVAIVAQAVWGMARNLCPDRERASIASAAAIFSILVAGAIGQVGAIIAGAVAGLVLCRSSDSLPAMPIRFPISRRFGIAALAASVVLLVGLPVLAAATGSHGVAVFDAFYRSGALVFGGGHVVLPLLEAEVVQTGWVSHDVFLAGYGAAQAIPGPLFTFSAYLGAVVGPQPNGITGAIIALIAIFLPGFLVLLGTIPFWDAFRAHPSGQAAMRGTNAAVVGILGAALYDPVFVTAITGPYAFALALFCFGLLVIWKTPPWLVVLIGALAGAAMTIAGVQ